MFGDGIHKLTAMQQYNQGTGVTFTSTPTQTTKFIVEEQTTDGCWFTYEQTVTVQALPRHHD